MSSITDSQAQSVLTPVQLMWINLFQDTLAALALATDRPQRRVLDRKPEGRNAPLITIPMWKTIATQSAYQLAVTFILYFAGPQIFRCDTAFEIQQVGTLVFNTHVWMQIFNMYKYVPNTSSLVWILIRPNVMLTWACSQLPAIRQHPQYFRGNVQQWAISADHDLDDWTTGPDHFRWGPGLLRRRADRTSVGRSPSFWGC